MKRKMQEYDELKLELEKMKRSNYVGSDKI